MFKQAAEGRGQRLYEEARRLIPGGTQLLSKRPELFAPGQWPTYFGEAHGCEVIDLDGRHFLDFTHNGVGACLLGYAHPVVTAAVVRRVTLGSMSSLNSPEEVELARQLLNLHPWAERVRFARCGGEAMAVAARIVRADTGRDVIAFCGYHGWCDWYLAANLGADHALDGHLLPGLSPAGVPRGLRGTALPFGYNRVDELREIVRQHGRHLAAVIMEPTRNTEPAPGFLDDVRSLCDDCGARLMLDEITTGFRLARGGVHLRYGIDPDLAVFAKALGNGHPIAAIVGKAAIMEAAQDSFLSSTYWSESVGPTAALATLRVMDEMDVPLHVARIGRRTCGGVGALATTHGLPLKVGGLPALTTLSFDHPESAALLTLFSVRMLRHGFLAGGAFYPTLAHQDRHVDSYLAAVDTVFAELADALRCGDVRARIGGPVKQSGFMRLT
jgi:glutamate-1-semialdehyde 2,1-aminomutase